MTLDTLEDTRRLVEFEKPVEKRSFLGVELEKAEITNSPFVPKIEKFNDYVNDEFSQWLQQQIAISVLNGDPIMVEGGTSLGKSTTVKYMAALLGYEVHYINLHGVTDVEDLMGRLAPNIDRKSSAETEYIFKPGRITTGLKVEPGKKKIILLDEIGAAKPEVLIRLHEVLDAHERGLAVNLTEDASQNLQTDRMSSFFVGLTNPPGRGFSGRNAFDKAQLRRWVYLKAPTDLPKEVFEFRTEAAFGLNPGVAEVAEEKYLYSLDQPLLHEQLRDIPGIKEILKKYNEFHFAAKQLVKERKVGADQPQPFEYDDNMERQRVMDFIRRFYNGDINDTFQNALRYYYANKVESEVDKAKLELLIQIVEYTPSPTNSKKKTLGAPSGGSSFNGMPIASPLGADFVSAADMGTSFPSGPFGTSDALPMPEVSAESFRDEDEKVLEREFTLEQREKLEAKGYVIIELGGEHIHGLRGYGLKINTSWSGVTILDLQVSRYVQLAIKPDQFFLRGSNDLDFEQQEEKVLEFSKKIGEEIPGVEAIIGKVPDYLDLLHRYKMRYGKDLILRRGVGLRTSLWGESYSIETPTDDFADRDEFGLYQMDPEVRLKGIFAAPFIVAKDEHLEIEIPGSEMRGIEDVSEPEITESEPVRRAKEIDDIYNDEYYDWLDTLGAEISIPSLPEYITPEVVERLRKSGMELRYIPQLWDEEEMKRLVAEKSPVEMLEHLNRHYPNWKKTESLTTEEQSDPSVVRNLDTWYWGLVKAGSVEIPKVGGYWVAVETMPKPTSYEEYKEKLGIPVRSRTSCIIAENEIRGKKEEFLRYTGLTGDNVDLRMLSAIEWNLLGNREGWGSTDTMEWTSTEFKRSAPSNIIVGCKRKGGAGYAFWANRNDVADPSTLEGYGFRVAAVFKNIPES